MTNVLFSDSAKSDLLEAWLFIAEESIDAADGVIEAIYQEAQILSLQPLMGRVRSELAQDIRSWPTSTRYILFYVPSDDGVKVVRILHHARDITNVLMS